MKNTKKLNTVENANMILALAQKISAEHAVMTQNTKEEYCIEMFSSVKKERAQVWICRQHVDIYVSSKVEKMYNALEETEQYKRSTFVDTTQRKRVYKTIEEITDFLNQFVEVKATKKATAKKTTTKKVNRKENKTA